MTVRGMAVYKNHYSTLNINWVMFS